jgi:hemoglobin
VHAALPDLDATHFAHWLALFKETADEICPPEAADLFVDRSQRIAESLQTGIAIERRRGIPLAPVL